MNITNIWGCSLTINWTKNTEVLYKKGQSRLYFLRRLRSFNICWTMLRMFFESVVASTILLAVVCWGSRLRVADANRLNKLIRKASVVVGADLDSLTAASDRRMLSKVRVILQHVSHPFHNAIEQRSTFSQRLRGRPHKNANRTRIASFWLTVHMDPENTAPENALF